MQSESRGLPEGRAAWRVLVLAPGRSRGLQEGGAAGPELALLLEALLGLGEGPVPLGGVGLSLRYGSRLGMVEGWRAVAAELRCADGLRVGGSG